MMKDGLYQVTTSCLCAGFTITGGKPVNIAPILRKKFEYWKTIAKRVSLMRPYQLLPMPMPAEYDPAEKDPLFFYNNFVKHFVSDMIQMMDTGLLIDEKAVEDLRLTIDNVLADVKARLSSNKIISAYQEHRRPAAQKAYAEKCTQSVRTIDYYIKDFNQKDLVHRTWVVNTYLKKLHKENDSKEKWTLNDLKKYNLFLKDRFVQALCDKRPLSTNPHVISGMKELAKYKLELWNRPRYENAKKPVPMDQFNPNSPKQKQELFSMLGIEPLAVSKDTGEPSWGREQLEELKNTTNDKDLIHLLEALIDFSYSAIIKNNFLKAFDSYTIDGVLHGNIKLFGAKSFRNTSNSPNLLNAPSTKSIYAKPLKKCFIAGDGRVVYTIDLNALEDRGIANLSQDENKMNIFREGLDGHSLNACGYFVDEIAKIMGVNKNNVEYVKEFFRLSEDGNKKLKTIRQNSKAPTFKLAYGGYPDSHKGGVITPEIFNNYHQVLYPGITKYREEYVLPTTRRQGYIHLGLGCRMYSSDPDQAIRTINNATVQFWSILTLIAINELNYRVKEVGLFDEVKVTSTIYDSIYTSCVRDAEVLAWVNENLVEILTTDYLEDQQIPNEAEGEIGLNWADLYKVPNHATPEEINEILKSF